VHIRADRDDLADAFARANRAVGVRPALPILSGVKCEIKGSELHITGTDLDVTIRTAVVVEVMAEGSSVVPSRLVTEAIKKMPAGVVSLKSDGHELEITGRGPKFAIRELPVDDFPDVPAPDFSNSVDIDGDTFADAVKQVGVAASIDSARPVLTGISLEATEAGFDMVATDSYRLAIRNFGGVTIPQSGLVPARALLQVGPAIGAPKVQVAIGAREASFGSDRGSVTVRLIEGSFPEVRRLIPDAYPIEFQVNKAVFTEALGRAGLFAEDHIPVRLHLSEAGMEVNVSRQDVGGEVEHVDGTYKGEEPEVTIAFNPKYLGDGISSLAGDEVLIQVRDGQKPSVLRGLNEDDFLYLLMPIRI
jgi:DNA polymerase-3 subunit beta